jgi:hypothetical protein
MKKHYKRNTSREKEKIEERCDPSIISVDRDKILIYK